MDVSAWCYKWMGGCIVEKLKLKLSDHDMFANTKGLFWLLNSNDTRSSSTSNQAQEHCIVWAQIISLKLQVRRVLWASWVEFNLLHRWRYSKCPFMIFKNSQSLQRCGNRIRFGPNKFGSNQLLPNLPNLAVYSCPMVGQPDWGKGVGWRIVVCPGLTSCQLSHYCPLFGENDPSLLPWEIKFWDNF